MKTILKTSTFCLATLVLFIFSTIPLKAQDEEKVIPSHGNMGKKMELMQAQKIAFITNELKLTPEEAEKFWPLYHEFEAKKMEIMKIPMGEWRSEQTDLDRLTDKEADALIIDKFKEEQAMLDLKTEYYYKYKEVIPVKKVVRLYESEKKFKRMLLEKLRNGRLHETKDKYHKRLKEKN